MSWNTPTHATLSAFSEHRLTDDTQQTSNRVLANSWLRDIANQCLQAARAKVLAYLGLGRPSFIDSAGDGRTGAVSVQSSTKMIAYAAVDLQRGIRDSGFVLRHDSVELPELNIAFVTEVCESIV